MPKTVPNSLYIVIYLKPSANKAISFTLQMNKLSLWWLKWLAPGYAARRRENWNSQVKDLYALPYCVPLWITELWTACSLKFTLQIATSCNNYDNKVDLTAVPTPRQHLIHLSHLLSRAVLFSSRLIWKTIQENWGEIKCSLSTIPNKY